jgi:hypothetical protein
MTHECTSQANARPFTLLPMALQTVGEPVLAFKYKPLFKTLSETRFRLD